MGQIADDIIDGLACEFCGIFFEEEHGHPVVCESCWATLTQKEKKGHVKAYLKEL